MTDEIFNTITGLVPALLTFLGGFAAAYFAWRNKQLEVEPDADRAVADLQVQLAKAAEHMVSPLNAQIEALAKRLEVKAAEIDELRNVIRRQNDKISLLENENLTLRMEMAQLRQDKERAERRYERIYEQWTRIKKEVDTGKLESGPHNIPKDGE